MKSAIVLNLALLLATSSVADIMEHELNEFGKSTSACEDGLPTLSIASENILNTMSEWNAFIKKYPLHVVGGADSSCA